MRELFDEVFGQAAASAHEAGRTISRGPQRKRFYTRAGLQDAPDGFAILLDDKPVRTPSRKLLTLPTGALAEAIVAEWQAQGEFIDPMTMPLTRLANSVIDAVAGNVAPVVDDIAKYFGSDLLFYRAGHPDELIAREAEAWDPVLFWAAETLGAHFILAEGIMHVSQPAQAIAAARAGLPEDAWTVAALHLVTTITGSALLALALLKRHLTADQVWSVAHVDEDWNVEHWGIDEEVAARRASRLIDFSAAARVVTELGPACG